jgi:hypothetical protein
MARLFTANEKPYGYLAASQACRVIPLAKAAGKTSQIAAIPLPTPHVSPLKRPGTLMIFPGNDHLSATNSQDG